MSVRSTALGAILVVEALAHTLLVQSMPHIATSGFAQGLQNAERGLFRLLVAYAVFCAILAGSRASPSSAVPALPVPATASLRPRWFAVHVVSFAALLVLSFELHSNESAAAGRELGIAWLMCASLALAALFAALAPYALWNRAARSHRGVLLRAVLPAVATLAAIYLSQSLWRPAATLTFHVVATMLRPIAAGFTMDPDSLTLGTGRFLVTIADACSGLEGMGLMLVFSVSWLWFFRREFYFPRALMIIPAAVALMFLLNSVRIAALVLIGINDINFAAMPPHAGLDCDTPHTKVTAPMLIDGYRHLIEVAHAHGLRIFGATITPASLPPEREALRLAVNRWIRSGGGFDGVVDFDAALRNPAQVDELLPRFDSGDHVHPSDAGYAQMAAAVPLELLEAAPVHAVRPAP